MRDNRHLLPVAVALMVILAVLSGCYTPPATPTPGPTVAPTPMPTAPARDLPTGVTDKEIKLGGTFPLSGPSSVAGVVARASEAYYAYVNEIQGGVDGRKITFKYLDDGYQPTKTIQLTKQLVEQDKVFLLTGSHGTTTQAAVVDYLNEQKVPQLFLTSGANSWSADPGKYPWTMAWLPSYTDEAAAYARYLLEQAPQAKVGIAYQDDEIGQDYVKGFEAGLGEEAKTVIVGAQGFAASAVDVSAQVKALKSAGAQVVFAACSEKSMARVLAAIYQFNWKPFIFVASAGSSLVAMTSVPPILVEGSVSAVFCKDPLNSRWSKDLGMALYVNVGQRYYPEGNPVDIENIYGMAEAWTVERLLKAAGPDLTREGVMKAAQNMYYEDNPFLLPGVVMKTTPNDTRPIRSFYLAKYADNLWVPFGNVFDVREK